MLPGTAFEHRAYLRPGPLALALHVYLENDGRPWRTPREISADPNPRRPLMLEALAGDRAPALYLGRPCYLVGPPLPAGCSPLLWTHRRYAPEVVDSLAAALAHFLDERPHEQLVFLGHSGGGTLAVLLAERFAQTRAVVTLAANLDLGAWSRLHGYSPLDGSLDPRTRPPLPPTVAQWHYVGELDREVPPTLAQGYRIDHPRAGVEAVPGQDHACCWLEHWPAVLARLRALGL